MADEFDCSIRVWLLAHCLFVVTITWPLRVHHALRRALALLDLSSS